MRELQALSLLKTISTHAFYFSLLVKKQGNFLSLEVKEFKFSTPHAKVKHSRDLKYKYWRNVKGSLKNSTVQSTIYP